jgi:hypothetical protein
VNKFSGAFQLFIGLKLFFNKIFNSFYVVIGGGFEFFDALGIGFGKAGLDRFEFGQCLGRKRGQFRKPCIGQCLEPFDFYNDAVVHESGFREQGAQIGHFGLVTAVKRADCCKGA